MKTASEVIDFLRAEHARARRLAAEAGELVQRLAKPGVSFERNGRNRFAGVLPKAVDRMTRRYDESRKIGRTLHLVEMKFGGAQ